MSIIAGAISRSGLDLPQELCRALAANLSRAPGESIETFGGRGWLLAQADVGAYRCKGSIGNGVGAALVVAGEPLLGGERYASCRNREDELRFMFEDLRAGRTDAVESSTGTYCCAFYSAQDHRLTLVSDKVGVRPIYYAVLPDFAVFASALRILEAADLVGSGIDLRGAYETSSFGFPFGERTCYDNVRTIGPAQIVRLTRDGVSRASYFRWDRLGYAEDPEGVLVSKLVASFERAVERRLRDDRVVLSFLSGGLDSRATVAALRRRGTQVFTVNFAPADTQDRVYAELAAETLGTVHHQLNVLASRTVNANRQEHLRGWVDSLSQRGTPPDRPGCIWSGDGGSVGLGHIYMDDATVRLLDHGDLDAAMASFLRFNQLAGAHNGVMTRSFRATTRDWHVEAVRAEFLALDRRLDGRSLFLFLLMNDQRRHLAGHFENIDSHRFEFQLPFFDAEVLETVVRAPVTAFLRHRLYYRWLEALSPAAVSIPWQVYPNHEPCPIPDPRALGYQWRKHYFGLAEERRLARAQGREGLALLTRRHFPSHLLSRSRFAAAVAFSLSGSNRLAHLTRVGATFARAWQRARMRGIAPT
ncbi:MAG TPA: asparagine synthase-related protein [Burkholderiales bacterium]|nr:asparagine synthase-related protein [Burkholderiales bacterium]